MFETPEPPHVEPSESCRELLRRIVGAESVALRISPFATIALTHGAFLANREDKMLGSIGAWNTWGSCT
jgi:hypothetical protein